MRVVYSYINFNDTDSIGTDYLFPGILSAFKSIELYGNATLYTTKSNIEKLKKFNLPFTDYIEIETPSLTQVTPALAKLLTYTLQKEPFIHLDLDVILNSTYNLDTSDQVPVKFSHKDIPNPVEIAYIDGIYNAYLHPGFILGKKYGYDMFQGLVVNEIPNMGIISCYDPAVFAHATHKALEIYYDNIDFFTRDHLMGVCFLEQGLIHMYLRQISKAYDDSIHRKTNFIYDSDNLLFIHEKDSHIIVPEPISTNELTFNDSKDLIENFNLDKYHSYHFLGESKSKPLSQFLILDKLKKYMSIGELINIENTLDRKNRNFVREYLQFIR